MATKSTSERGRKLLEECTLFSALDQRARHEIAAYARPRKFIAGELICRLHHPGDSMMAVVLGTVRISLPAIKGKEIILADLQAGSSSARSLFSMARRVRQMQRRIRSVSLWC